MKLTDWVYCEFELGQIVVVSCAELIDKKPGDSKVNIANEIININKKIPLSTLLLFNPFFIFYYYCCHF